MASWKNVQYKNGQYRTSEGGGGSSTLSGLDDVTISSVSNGQVLKYNSTSSKWVNANDISVTALEDLTDVDIDTKSDGDVLTYNEAQDRWEAAEPLGGGVNDVEVDGLSVVNDGVAEITTPDASRIEYDNQQSGLSATDVQSAIDELSQSTGVSALNDLTDTAISSPSNNQVLTYDSSTSKWKNATGGASSLNDLTDVDTTGVLDNNFLAYSTGQSKWVPATVSGGNVDDVQVNGTSVVDSNKVAQIKSYKEVTEAQYEALPSTKLTDGVMYLIKDIPSGAEGYPPLIYSENEREIGVWIDGKPLYQKVIKNISLTHNTWTTVFNGSSISASVKYFYGAIGIDGNTTNPYCNSDYNRGTNSEYVCTSFNTNVSIVANVVAPETLIYGIVQYTKTTDTPGSGTWGGNGALAHHYSTDEQIVGTWIDGKPLYEKTINCGTLPNNTTKSVLHYISNLEYVVEVHGTTQDESTKECLKIPHTQRNNVQSQIQIGVDTSAITIFTAADQRRFTKTYITVQYTKTTD